MMTAKPKRKEATDKLLNLVKSKKEPPARKHNVTVRLTENELESLKNMAEGEDRSLQQILRRLIVPALELPQSV
jgi:hypothetical protein